MIFTEALKELAPFGAIRAAINTRNPVLAKGVLGSSPTGVSVDLAVELGRQLETDVSLVCYESAGDVFKAMASNSWDIAFLAIEPGRTDAIAFTEPYVVIEGTYLVHTQSTFLSVRDIDSPGVRVAVVENAAYDLFLTRSLYTAKIVRARNHREATEAFASGRADVLAGVRQALDRHADAHAGTRVIPDSYMTLRQAMATPRARGQAAALLKGFIRKVKATNFVETSLATSGHSTLLVAPYEPAK